jgi:hypothetical protein
MFDTDQRVPLGVSAAATLAPETDRDRGVRRRVACPIRTVLALQQVAPCPALERVIARIAPERVGPVSPDQHVRRRIAHQRVGVIGPDQRLDPGQGIPLGVTAGSVAGPETDDDGFGRAGVACGVPTVLAVDDVCALAADESIVPGIAPERVGPVAATKRIVTEIADQRVGEC